MMKRQTWAAIAAAAGLLLAAGTADAQVSSEGMGKILPVEMFTCKFNKGQGAADLDKVIARWSKYMDDKHENNYAAWTLTPVYYGPEQDFDVLWLGAWKDGNAMGEGTDRWLANNELQATFAKVVDCNYHVAMASAMYKAPADGPTPSSGFITMRNCKLNKGHRYSDVQAADVKWAAELVHAGDKSGYWHWFPAFGGGDADFDYKVVHSYPTFADIGTAFDRYTNGGGRERAKEIFGDIDTCDDARVYATTVRRLVRLRE